MIRKYNLCKPEIKDKYKKNSYVNSKKMRHILIENIDKNEIYVPNDICLGEENKDLGILLYGTNAVGKTSLIKIMYGHFHLLLILFVDNSLYILYIFY